MVDVAEIKLWNQLVGAVIWNDKQQVASFEFATSFISKGIDVAPIKMPIVQGARVYRFPELRQKKEEGFDTFKGLPGFLADALPDRYGNTLINLWLAQQKRASNSMNPVEQLCFIGLRGMGALEFEPAQPTSKKPAFDIEIGGLIEAAKQILTNREDFKTNLNQDQQHALIEILKVGTSAGGARPKAVIAYNPKSGEVKSGQTLAPKGFEHWLLKMDGVSGVQFGDSSGWGRVEYAYYLMALESGVEMMESKLLEENGRAHFMTKRFDREGNNTKHHIQTWCGIQHFDYNEMYAFSYEQLFETMRKLRLTYPEAEQMFKRMVFNVLATNCDDHTKNFAFRLKQNEKWTLAPAYDICFAFDPTNHWVSQQTLSVNGKRRNITQADLMTIANANSIKKGAAIINQINTVVKNWKHYADAVNLNKVLTDRIEANLHTL